MNIARASVILRQGVVSKIIANGATTANISRGASLPKHSASLHTHPAKSGVLLQYALTTASRSIAVAGAFGPSTLTANPVSNIAVRGLASAARRRKRNKSAKKSSTEQKWDLGIPSLLPEWKLMALPSGLKDDIVAGTTVAAVAVPLSLAVGLASGMNAVDGLTSAIASGVMCAFLGGAPLAISGPTAAMAAVVFNVIHTAGLSGLFYVTFGAGLLQTMTGVLGIGHLVKFMPVPIINAFTTGVAGIIAVGQIPRALGLPPASGGGTIGILHHIFDNAHAMVPAACAVTGLTMAINQFLPMVTKKVPATLAAVVGSAAAANLAGLDIALVTGIPDTLPMPHFPGLPHLDTLPFIASSIMLVFGFASMESLLSAVSVDKITKAAKPSDPSQELIGQGFGNMATALVGGVPSAAVIVRSSLNASAGAKTRRAGLVQSGVIVGSVVAFNKVLEMIPIATLSGVLLSVATKMANPKELAHIFKVSPIEAAIFAGSAGTIFFVDMMTGIQAGLMAEVMYAFYQRTDGPLFQNLSHRISLDPVWIYGFGGSNVKSVTLELEGNLDFLSVIELDSIKKDLYAPLYFADGQSGQLEIDARKLISVDFTGLDVLSGIISDLCVQQHVKIHFSPDEDSQYLQETLLLADRSGQIKKYLLEDEEELAKTPLTPEAAVASA